MTQSSNLGFPRIGLNRELKKAVEAYWKADISQQALQATAQQLRKQHWRLQQSAGIDFIPSNDFSFYDHVLDTTAMVGAIPPRYQLMGERVDLDTYFAMARGSETVTPMEMTKWFDTNYHYIVPEFEKDQSFSLRSTNVVDEFREAQELGIVTRPVLLGPVSYLLLGKSKCPDLDPIDLIDAIIPVYQQVLSELNHTGAQWVQIDEPMLVQDFPEKVVTVFQDTYRYLCQQQERPKICLTAYFGGIEDKIEWLSKLTFEALHLDLVRAPRQLDAVLRYLPESLILSLGVINGRNIWKADLHSVLSVLEKVTSQVRSDRVIIAPSCSLLHCPMDLDEETQLPVEIKERLAFSKQKLHEIAVVKQAIGQGREAVADELTANRQVFERAEKSTLIHNSMVQERMRALNEGMFIRSKPYCERRKAQQDSLALPVFPTTTIGSFPQTAHIRKTRAGFKKGTISKADYTTTMQQEIEKVIRFQEKIGLDVLVHGEPERNDMVEYFGQLLDGFTFTKNGWVQSYGSRCVKPPVIYGDVSRPAAMTVEWSLYAQSLTDRPVKGMLTGPITILQWSFVREDQPRKDTAWQIALAIQDEVSDLENAGIKVIQIDEPALREGTPLRQSEWTGYFDWAVKAFRLATSTAMPATQIHTHMCYCDFNDIMPAIAALDADVISIEASRSDAELLDAFIDYNYPNEIGPGVYDIHSPRVPSVEEVEELLEKMLSRIHRDRLWVNPDCGLKTRDWPEVEASLENMVAAAAKLRNT